MAEHPPTIAPTAQPCRRDRRLILQAAAGWLAAAIGVPALAQAAAGAPAVAQPATSGRPIRLVVPFPVGGGTDIMGRLLAHGMSEELGTTIIVDNVPGATGTLGSTQVARSAADGQTLLLGISATHAIAPAVFKDLKYQPAKDFTALARVAHGGNVLVAHPGYGADTVPAMVALARQSKEPLMYGSWGNGSGGHLAAESLRQLTGIDLRHVPYKGVTPLLQDLAGGQIPIAMADVAGALPMLRSGRIKALAVTGRKRSSALPEVPTLAESGIGFDTESWFALFAPAGLAPARLEVLAAASARALARPEVTEKIRSLGMESEPITREAFEQDWHRDIDTWARIARAGGVQLD